MKSDILEPYKTIVNFLGKTLGPDYEVVLQDLTDGNNSIIAIANSHVSGRKIGSPLTNAALQMLSSKAYLSKDFLCNYKGISENGHVLRSSTMFIKDSDGIPVGLMCINFDDSRYTELSKKLFSVIHPSDFFTTDLESNKTYPSSPAMTSEVYAPITENFPMDIPTLMQKIFDDSTEDLTTPIDHLNQFERKDIMIKLNNQGLCQMKGAVSFVAKKFSCSTATVYRYLNEISNG